MRGFRSDHGSTATVKRPLRLNPMLRAASSASRKSPTSIEIAVVTIVPGFPPSAHETRQLLQLAPRCPTIYGYRGDRRSFQESLDPSRGHQRCSGIDNDDVAGRAVISIQHRPRDLQIPLFAAAL